MAASRHAAHAVADPTRCYWRRKGSCAQRLQIHGCSSCSTHGGRRSHGQHIEVRPYRSVLTAQHAARACTRPKAWVSPPARIPPAIELPRRTYAAPPACPPSARRRDVGYMSNFTGGFEVRCKRAEPKIALEPAPLPSRLRRRRNPCKPDQRVRCGMQTISCATGTWREPPRVR